MMKHMRRRGRPQPPNPGEPVPSVPPVGKAESRKGVQGDISSWSQAGGGKGRQRVFERWKGTQSPLQAIGAPSTTGA